MRFSRVCFCCSGVCMSILWPARDEDLCYISAPPSQEWCCAPRRRLCVLGATGSIGVSALKVMEAQPERCDVVALAGARNVELLAQQACRWRPRWLGILDEAGAEKLRHLLPAGYAPEIVTGQDGYARLAALEEVDTVLSAQVGAAGLRGTVAAVLAGKVICLANKESLVLAGDLVRQLCARTGAVILPVDSEHNAIFQCLAGRSGVSVKHIIVTASGGPFRSLSQEALAKVTPQMALRHPNWDMGAKITIDSATLMNKGLEVMEACHLYGVPESRVRVLIHPQSLVHSLVAFRDNSLLAQLGVPDMRMAIGHCLLWPHCVLAGAEALDLVSAGTLTFLEPQESLFPCLDLARQALRKRGNAPIILNAANEVAVALFLRGQCGFLDIPHFVAKALTNADGAKAWEESPLPEQEDALRESVMRHLAHIEKIDGNIRQQVYAWAERGV